MKVGAIGAYSPVSYISPYAEANAGTTNSSVPIAASKIQGTEGVSAISEADGTKVDKTDPNYKCQTCANRKYQDGSNEHDVSFKNASKVAPEAAASAVRSHEQQHVKNAYEKADQNNGKVVSATVAIHTSVCPECGKTYVSGGTTKTTIKYSEVENPYQQNMQNLFDGYLRGVNLDMEM